MEAVGEGDRLAGQDSRQQASRAIGGFDSRSLLAGEALEQDFGVAVDAQVLDGLCILRRAGRIVPAGRLGERRAQRKAEGGLHRDY